MKKLNLLGNGFTRREDLDFTDDGARFTAYEYNGLIITKCTYRGEYFISVRVDYLQGYNFIYEDYNEKDWYKLADEFNGVYEVDVDKLKANIDIIKKGVEELEEEIKNDPIDGALMENRLLQEEKMITNFINENKIIDITKFNKYEISNLVGYLNSLNDLLNIVKRELENKNYTRYQYKWLQKHNAIHISNTQENFYCKQILNILNKGE